MASTPRSTRLVTSQGWSSEADANLAVTRTSVLQEKRYHWHDLKAATNGFHKNYVVGESTYASVYRGVMKDGSAVAVKRLKSARSRAKHDFESDVVSIAKVCHKNVVTLLGYSSTFLEKVFVFQYFPTGSLDAVLHGDWEGPTPLDWDKRKAILLGIAEGLGYLHNLKPAIAHGRLTSKNVMLTQNFTPKLIDYHIGHPALRNRPTQIPDIEWAMGYMAPELGMKMDTACVKRDCYSYGFLLLEMVSGRRPWRLLNAANAAGLKQRDWIGASFSNIQSLVDPRMTHLPSHSHPPLWEVQKVLQLAIVCMADLPGQRPAISDIIRFLREELLITTGPAELQDLFIELVVGEDTQQQRHVDSGNEVGAGSYVKLEEASNVSDSPASQFMTSTSKSTGNAGYR